MPQPSGRIGPYELVSPLGRGAMGEVFRARDTRLKRDVAVKLLPASFANDPERLVRFEREAQVLASLNHQNIAAIHGIEEFDGGRALVLELVEGETLAERIARGPVPIAEALTIAAQIARALEAAHAAGIVHRDLKPANIKLRPDGVVKVLDFGLAKVLDPLERALDTGVTVTSSGLTQSGVILGTAAYMSPEQARGKAADRRADIWAFGCVLFGMLSARSPFAGISSTDVLSAITRDEPAWHALPTSTPPRIRRLLSRLLQKDPDRRLHDIADARIEIDTPDDDALHAPDRATPQHLRFVGVAGWVVAALAVAWIGLAGRDRTPPASAVGRTALTVPLPPGAAVDGVALSPSGRTIVYELTVGAAGGSSGRRQLYARDLNELDAVGMTGTEGARQPFFSPDGAWIGFFADGKLKKAPLDGGRPVIVCDAPLGWGASWAADDTIVFTAAQASSIARMLYRVNARDGSVTWLSPVSDAVTPRWPTVLPDARTILFSAFTSNADGQARLTVRRPDGSFHDLGEMGTAPKLLGTTHLLWAREGRLFKAPFDVQRTAFTGSSTLVTSDLAMDSFSGLAKYAASSSGTLTYVAGGVDGARREIVVANAKGELEPLDIAPRMFEQPAFSPDGRRFAVRTMEREETGGIWIGNLTRIALMRLTVPRPGSESPVWSPDGRRIAFVSGTADPGQEVYVKPFDDSGDAVLVWRTPQHGHVGDWSPDGQTLLVMISDPKSFGDIWTVPLQDGNPMPWLKTAYSEREPKFSPDGKWVAYTSDESGDDEVYVRPYPGPGGKTPVSVGGGSQPLWVRDTGALIYRQGRTFMRVDIRLDPTLGVGASQQLFSGDFDRGPVTGQPGYDVSPDGQRLILIRPVPAQAPPIMWVIIGPTEAP